MEAVDTSEEVIRLREENAQLNKLLEDSAATLYAVNDQLHKERCTNEKLMTYLKESERAAHVLYGENDQLRQELLQAQKKINEQTQRSSDGERHSSNDDNTTISNKLNNHLIEEEKLLMRHKTMANSLKSLAGELVDNIADADVEISMIMKRFPSVDFERKAVEQDPYKSTKGWVGRRSPGKLGTVSSADSAEDPDPAQLVTPHKDPHISPALVKGYLYGSPSERYPLIEPRVIFETEGEERQEQVSESEGEDEEEGEQQDHVSESKEEKNDGEVSEKNEEQVSEGEDGQEEGGIVRQLVKVEEIKEECYPES